MDNIDNKIMPIEASPSSSSSSPSIKVTRSIRVTNRLTGKRKRCSRGKRRNKRTHRCRKKN